MNLRAVPVKGLLSQPSPPKEEYVFRPSNPKGIASSSPGLRGTSYPGAGGPLNLNPERVLSNTLNRYKEERRMTGAVGE